MKTSNLIRTANFLFLTLLLVAFIAKGPEWVKNSLERAKKQLSNALQANTDPTRIPRSTKKDGSIHLVPSDDWTSGFFAGSLWYMYEYTKDEQWKKEAEKWTASLEKEKHNKSTHDLGFMLYCSFGNGYRLTGKEQYKEVLLEGANSLITRFNPKVGLIKSWDSSEKWQYPVIIDNMMNLELLFWTTKVSGDSIYYNIAVTHALNTIKHHFRPDNSSFHVINYDTTTGKVLWKGTHQGYSDESAWARGQAWGLYGYTMTYRETKDKRFLDQATKIADFFINHKNLPADRIPYWDFNAPDQPKAPRDAAAAAIASSGLLELSKYAGKKGKTYQEAATAMIKSLSTPGYTAKEGTNNNFILMHATGHLPGDSEIDVPLVYADYYYIEGLMRLNKGK